MSFKNCWTISSSYDFQAHQQRSQRRCCFSQTALLWFEVLPDLSPALPVLSLALPGAPSPVVGTPSYSEGWQKCHPRVWYSPEIDASKFTLHILSDTSGGFQCLKYILLMEQHGTSCDKFESTWDCRPMNAGIPNPLWEMPGLLCIFIWRTAGDISDSPDVPRAIRIPSTYDAQIIVHYQLLNHTIVTSITFNILLFAARD